VSLVNVTATPPVLNGTAPAISPPEAFERERLSLKPTRALILHREIVAFVKRAAFHGSCPLLR